MDILEGLADLLTWQGRRAEAIAYLDQASALDAGRNDVQLRRGRLLHALGRQSEAGAAYALVFSLRGLFVGWKTGWPSLLLNSSAKITKANRSLRSVELPVRLESTVEWDTLRFTGTPAIPVKATYFTLADARRRAMG